MIFQEQFADEILGGRADILEEGFWEVQVDLGYVEERLLVVGSHKRWMCRQHHVCQHTEAPVRQETHIYYIIVYSLNLISFYLLSFLMISLTN